jgi:hypothetical protein
MEHRAVTSRLMEIDPRTSSQPFIMNAIHPIVRSLRFYEIVPILIIIGCEQCFTQKSYSAIIPNRDTLRFDNGIHYSVEKRSSCQSVFGRTINDINKNNYLKDSMSPVLIMEICPELRNAMLREYIRQPLSGNADNNITWKLRIYLVGNPKLENELRRKVQRFGVPYDPLRPTAWQIGYTFYVHDIIGWLEKKLNWIITGRTD